MIIQQVPRGTQASLTSLQDLAHPGSCMLVGLVSKMPSAFVAIMAMQFGIQTQHNGRCISPGISCNKQVPTPCNIAVILTCDCCSLCRPCQQSETIGSLNDSSADIVSVITSCFAQRRWTLWLFSVACFAGLAIVLVLVRASGRRLRRLVQTALCGGIIALLVVFARIYMPGSQSHGHRLFLLVFLDFQFILVLLQASSFESCHHLSVARTELRDFPALMAHKLVDSGKRYAGRSWAQACRLIPWCRAIMNA